MTSHAATPEPLPVAVDPGEVQLRRDAASGAMCVADDEGRYGVTTIQFPIVHAWVAVDGGRLGVRIDCTDYPAQAPTSQPWAPAEDGPGAPLPVHRWPVGGRAPGVFRPEWSPANGNAPYLACDRWGLTSHPDWQTSIPHRVWTPSRTLVDYLDQLHDALIGTTLPAHAAA